MGETLQLDFLVRTVDEASAQLKAIQAEVRRTEAAGKAGAEKTSGAWERVKAGARVKEGFEKLRGVMLLVPSALAAVGAGLAALGLEAETAEERIGKLRATVDATRGMLDRLASDAARSAGDVRRLAIALAEASGDKQLAERLKLEEDLTAVVRLRGSLAGDELRAQDLIQRSVGEVARIDLEIVRQRRHLATLKEADAALAVIDLGQRRAISVAEERLVQLGHERGRAERGIRDAVWEVNGALRNQEEVALATARAFAATGFPHLRMFWKAPKPKGTPPRDRTEELQRELALLSASDDLAKAAVQHEIDLEEAAKRVNKRYRDQLEAVARLKYESALAEDEGRAADEAALARARAIAAARTEVAEAVAKGGAAFRKLAAAAKAYNDAEAARTLQTLGETQALLGQIQALAPGVAGGVAGVAASFVGLAAAIQAGLGPLGIVAQLLGIVAQVTGIFGGKKSAPSSGSAPAAARPTGGVVYNFYGPTDAQSAYRAASGAERSARGTGWDRRGGGW